MKMNSAYQRFATRLSALGLSCLLAAGTACIPARAAAPHLDTSAVITEQKPQPAVSSAKWKKVGKNLRLKSSSGKYKKGMVKYKGQYYYFNSKGNLKTGFVTHKKKTYYASPNQGAKGKGRILTGLVSVSGNYYYLNPASKPYPGAVSTGFQTIGGRRYYFDGKGRMLTGWISIGGNRYYANPGTTGNHGALLTGAQTINGVTYRFAADGRLESTVPAAAPSKTNTNTAATTLMTSFRPIYQYPELPTGCETTSLAMVLNYKGVPADKVNLATHYLDKGPVGKVSPWKAFVGDPRNSSAHGCYAPVVVNMANRYLTEKKSKLRASYISGRELETLAAYTSAGNPVIVWGTINCRAPYHSKTWVIDGQKIEWISPEHCVVLLGFRGTQVVIADPWTGRIVSYEKEVFRKGYNALHKQAVVIR